MQVYSNRTHSSNFAKYLKKRTNSLRMHVVLVEKYLGLSFSNQVAMDMYTHLLFHYAKEAQVNITSGSLRDYLGFRALSIHRQNL